MRELPTQGDAGGVVTCGRTPEPSLSLWLSVEQAYRESEAGALSHVLVDGRGPLWPGPNDLIHRPFRHLAGGENQVTLSHLGSAQVQERRGWGLRVGHILPGPHLRTGPPRSLHLALQAATAGQTLQRERMSQWRLAGGQSRGWSWG